MNWFYAHQGQQQGPVSDEELARLAATGVIAGTTLIWKEGMADWQPVSVARPDLLNAAAAASPQVGGMAVAPAQKDLVVQQMREGVLTAAPGQLQYAGFWIRWVAKVIDGLVIGIPVMAIILLFFGSMVMNVEAMDQMNRDPNKSAEVATQQVVFQLVMNLAVMMISVTYNGFMISKWGATLGKMALGLKVVTAEGAPATASRAWGRAFAEIISGMVCYIGYIIAGFDDQKRALHDHICSTRVIKTR